MIAKITCPQCSTEVEARHPFCGQCGYFLQGDAPASPSVEEELAGAVDHAPPALESVKPEPKLEPEPASPPVAYFALRLIRGAESDEVLFPLKAEGEDTIGRSDGDIELRDDPHVSPSHATLSNRGGSIYIRDEGSLNGVFVRMSGSIQLQFGELFIVGEQVFRIDESERQLPDVAEGGARFFSSNQRHPSTVKLSQILEGGQRGITWPIRSEGFTLGRQGCDLNFPHDRFMSSRHAKLKREGEGVQLTDLESRNGTYLQVKGERRLSEGDSILIGKQLLQVTSVEG